MSVYTDALRYIPAVVSGFKVISNILAPSFHQKHSQIAQDLKMVSAIKAIALEVGLTDPDRLMIVEDKEHKCITCTGTSFGRPILFVDSDLWAKDQAAAKYFIRYSLNHIVHNNSITLFLVPCIVAIATAILIPHSYSPLLVTLIVSIPTAASYWITLYVIGRLVCDHCISQSSPEEASRSYRLLKEIQKELQVNTNTQMAALKKKFKDIDLEETPLRGDPKALSSITEFVNKRSVKWAEALANIHRP